MEQSPPPNSPHTQSAADSSDEEIDYSAKPEFYDPKLDDRDEAWVRKQRKGSSRRSDAVLSCPACFTTVSVQSQRHERYVTQYRAVAVMNCNVGGGRGDGKPAGGGGSGSDSMEKVRCSVCETEVGVVDGDEVYHFFNVIPSEP